MKVSELKPNDRIIVIFDDDSPTEQNVGFRKDFNLHKSDIVFLAKNQEVEEFNLYNTLIDKYETNGTYLRWIDDVVNYLEEEWDEIEASINDAIKNNPPYVKGEMLENDLSE